MRSFAIVLHSAWLGAALLVVAVVAPAAFAVLPTRALAGALVGRVLPVLFLSAALLASAVGAWAWRQGRAHAGVAIASAVSLGCALVAQFVLDPRIRALRTAAGSAIDSLSVADSRRVEFGRLHGGSVLLLGVTMIATAASLVLLHILSSHSHVD